MKNRESIFKYFHEEFNYKKRSINLIAPLRFQVMYIRCLEMCLLVTDSDLKRFSLDSWNDETFREYAFEREREKRGSSCE